MTAPDPSSDLASPDVAARLAEWRATDAELGGFATIVSQRARIVELESEVDRLAERAEWWELETRRLESELRERRTDDEPVSPPVAGPGHRFGRRSR